MKKLLLPLFALLLFTACEKDSITDSQLDQQLQENKDETSKSSNQKIDVCHKGKIINISINAVAAHQAHGDAVDMDGDGYYDIDNPCSETDCDDTDATVNPDATEVIYDGIDNDCDPETLDDDLDQDGFNIDVDCDDTNAEVNPAMEEVCDNGIDDNCNGEIDENCCNLHPCLDEAIIQGEAWLDNILGGNGNRISTTITGCSTFTVYFYLKDRNGRDACYINYMEATGTPGNCGFTFSTHELVDCP